MKEERKKKKRRKGRGKEVKAAGYSLRSDK